MTGVQVLIARGALGVVAGAASLALLRVKHLHTLAPDRFDRGLVALFATTRVVLFALIFLVLHIPPRGDVAIFYLPEARSVLHGLMPYRDFASSYGPLHPYMDAGVLRLWNSPFALILFAILVEVFALRLLLPLARRLFPDRTVRRAGLLYLASPISLQFVTIDGHDNILLALLLGLALWSVLRVRDAASGFLTGIGVSLLKVIALFYAPVFFLAGQRRWRWSLGFLLSLVLGEGAWLVLRLPLLTPIRLEGALKQSGDLPFLVEGLLGLDIPGRLLDAIMLLALAGVWYLVARAARDRSLTDRVRLVLLALPAVTLTLELFAKKSWPPYLMIVLFPLCLLVATRGWRQVFLFECFSVVAVSEHSFWATILGSLGSDTMHLALTRHERGWSVYTVLLIALLAGYAWLLALSLRAFSSADLLPPLPSPRSRASGRGGAATQ